jgi:tryptophan synthase alpha chain
MTCSRFEQLPQRRALTVFFTAGYPRLNDTLPILSALQASEVDMIEIGFPFSDPVADGPTIQESNHVSLGNGMTVKKLFEQLASLRTGEITAPVLLMGSLNPIERYGRERFFEQAAACGVDGFIIPDMPFEEYMNRYKPLYHRYGVKPVFLVTSRTEPARLKAFDAEKPAFIYVVSSDAVTGGKAAVTEEREAFFKRLAEMKLSSRLLVGFGVSDRESFDAVTKHTSGAIIGSAFVRAIQDAPQGGSPDASDPQGIRTIVSDFIKRIR